MKILIGLGNPGQKYTQTRHNLGQQVVASLAPGAEFSLEKKLKSQLVKKNHGEETLVFALPTTFMNLSGDAVSALLSFFQVKVEDLVVFHDEIDLPEFEIRYKFGGGHRGHNGLRDIIQKIGSADFHRLRLGVGRPENPNYPVADYVLSKGAEAPPDFINQVKKILTANDLW